MTYDFDLFTIGAGSGGVRASRIAAGHGARVAVAEDYRAGGTCVIRGCVPKKLMVFASSFREGFADARAYGATDLSDRSSTALRQADVVFVRRAAVSVACNDKIACIRHRLTEELLQAFTTGCIDVRAIRRKELVRWHHATHNARAAHRLAIWRDMRRHVAFRAVIHDPVLASIRIHPNCRHITLALDRPRLLSFCWCGNGQRCGNSSDGDQRAALGQNSLQHNRFPFSLDTAFKAPILRGCS